MKIQHIAIWVKNLDAMKEFYGQYFGVSIGPKYTNEKKGFTSHFLSFPMGGKIELMQQDGIKEPGVAKGRTLGLAHIAIAVGSKDKVDELTQRMHNDGYTIIGQPRITGDGFYESVFLDPEGNYIEIVE